MTEDNKEKVMTMKDVQAKAEEKKCAAQQALVFVEEFLSEPMCGRCFPCSFGSYEANIRLKKIVAGIASDEDIERLRRIGTNMLEASMCKKGKDTAAFILDKIAAEDFAGHLTGDCSKRECTSLSSYLIIPEKCTNCGLCLDACKDHAITGEKRKPYLSGYQPMEIAQKRCTKCGECIKVCPDAAIVLITSKEMAGTVK
ncbi:MAG: 4Fe-4S binding protein [Nitrospirae bacterium]|nr:4Fe-4S binding protein [Nitrospirota bacterium]